MHSLAGAKSLEFTRYLPLLLILLALSIFTFGEHKVTLRGLAGVGHGDTFDLEIGALYRLEFQPAPGMLLTQDIEFAELERYSSWHGYLKVWATIEECFSEGNCNHRKMTVHDWTQIDEEPDAWKHLNPN